MRLRREHYFCIWCGCDLEASGRSVEHLIPASLFGNITTDDVCAACNSNFGTELDHTFLSDGTTITAALEAGVRPEELLTAYRARQSGADGITIETSVRRGISAVLPQLDRSDGPLIGDRNGVFDRGQITGMQRRTRERAQRRRPDLSHGEIHERVERLYRAFMMDPSVLEMRDDELGEGLRRFVIESCPTLFGTQSDPDQVTRAVGKVMFEAMQALVPFRVRRAMQPTFTRLKNFVQGRCAAEGIIGNSLLERSAARRHTIVVYGRGEQVGCTVRFFEKLEWVFSVKFQHAAGHYARVQEFESVLSVEF